MLVLLFSFHCFSFVSGQNGTGNFNPGTGNLTKRWNLDSVSKKESFFIQSYKPIYFIFSNWSDHPNNHPDSPNPLYTVKDTADFDKIECKFQISFKILLAKGLFRGNGDLWLGYTQTAWWQFYNDMRSRAFRETDYEPEFILNFATHYKIWGVNGKMIGVSLNHQSNGQTRPLSRGWNRLIVHAGFEAGKWNALLRYWARIEDVVNQNPEIKNYVGAADLIMYRNFNHHQISVKVTHSLNPQQSRGSAEVNWAFPLHGNLKGFLQVFHGFGQSLIDYNHEQTTLGIGLSAIEW